MKNDVKRKMVLHDRPKRALKSPPMLLRQKFFEHHFSASLPHTDEHKRSSNRASITRASESWLTVDAGANPIDPNFRLFCITHIYN